ncbi:bile acid:sodium symporter family protein [Arenicella xantha]|uniref:BASS family bile acid:Na+ symporter n=1 Tax=Arenicella xantha TaxID=644221 RepID=A0A395JM72_9GAMM|nr:bile acid:sodium symporter [Arenicella xantha]RBP51709.1 BASS family bile acid:Na+ symporter [Arenicella xantha]
MGELFLKYEYGLAAFQLVFAMLGMGATLSVSDFKDVLREPKSVTSGTLMQLLLVPAIAFMFIEAGAQTAGIAVGIALIASIPGGTTSNIFTYMARGNAPLSISITGITTLACLITTPLILSILVTEHLPPGFSMPTEQIIKEIGFTLLLPLCMGMVILKALPHYAAWISKWCIRASILAILLIVIGSSSAGRLDLDAFGQSNTLLLLGFFAVIALVTWLVGELIGFSESDQTAIEMELIVRNINLAVLLKASLFPIVVGADNSLGDQVFLAILLYGAVQLLMAAALIVWRRRSSRA